MIPVMFLVNLRVHRNKQERNKWPAGMFRNGTAVQDLSLSKFAMIQWAVVAIEVEVFSNDFELEKQQKDKMCQSLEQNSLNRGLCYLL